MVILHSYACKRLPEGEIVGRNPSEATEIAEMTPGFLYKVHFYSVLVAKIRLIVDLS